MTIRPAVATDIPAVRQIETDSPEASHWADADYLGGGCVVAESSGRLTGFLLSRKVAESEFEILNLGVSREFRRLGVASTLIRERLSGQAGDWYLEVRESNTAARNVYKKLGFLEIGVRSSYYEKPPERAIVMRFRS